MPTAFRPKSRPIGEHRITAPPPKPVRGILMFELVASSVEMSNSPMNLLVVGA